VEFLSQVPGFDQPSLLKEKAGSFIYGYLNSINENGRGIDEE
jgi:hypothetical protein